MNHLIKKDIVWLLWTLLIACVVALLLSIVQMYSRTATLDNVKRIEFNLLYKLFNENTSISRSDLTKTLDPLLSKKKYALFHVAILSEKNCSENAKIKYNQPFLCDTFNNSKSIQKFSDLEEIETSRIPNLKENNFESYLIKKFDYSNDWLVAKTNFYSKSSELSHLMYFLKNMYYQRHAINKIYQKGKFSFLIIFTVSLIFWSFIRLRDRQYRLEYSKNKEKEKKLQDELNKLDTKYNDTKLERYHKEQALLKLKAKLNDVKTESETERQKLIDDIKALQKDKDDLDQSFKENEDVIDLLEEERNELRKKIHLQMNKLDSSHQKLENDLVYENFESLRQLWRENITWKDRKEIESLVSLKDTNLPFTITQGFIAFEERIMQLVKYNNLYDYRNEKKDNLKYNIDQLLDNDIILLKYEHDYTKVRYARNDWFHAGVYPSIETIDFLINLLHDENAKPHL